MKNVFVLLLFIATFGVRASFAQDFRELEKVALAEMKEKSAVRCGGRYR